MVTRRMRRHTASRSSIVERKHRVSSAAGLERTDLLKFSHLKNSDAPLASFNRELVSTGVR